MNETQANPIIKLSSPCNPSILSLYLTIQWPYCGGVSGEMTKTGWSWSTTWQWPTISSLKTISTSMFIYTLYFHHTERVFQMLTFSY